MTDFFQKEVQACKSLAAKATNKDDRDYWLHQANSWEAILRSQQNGGAVGKRQAFSKPVASKLRH